jgi:hypothetical protein
MMKKSTYLFLVLVVASLPGMLFAQQDILLYNEDFNAGAAIFTLSRRRG